ncbi:MAG TPA: HEAT repeat domain-containing protein [Anaerolineales bacterium]|nr:HEAT repeat domain-containing protein [Anaerolineales bacterium]
MEELDIAIAELTSGEEERAERAAVTFARHGERALEALRAPLASPEADTRWWAVRALAEIPGKATSRLLIKALEDPETPVRQCAAQALRQQPDPDAISALIEAMHSEDALLARLAANALIAIGTSATTKLLEVLNSSPEAVRLEAARALAMIADQRAIPSLFQALDGDSALLEYWANEGLERMGVGMMFFKP